MNNKRKLINIIIVVLVLIMAFSIIGTGIFLHNKNIEDRKKQNRENEEVLVKKITDSYSKYVKVKEGSFLYKISNGKYEKIIKLDKDKEFTLEDIKIDKNTKYFLIKELGYYVKYQDVIKIDALSSKDMRYKSIYHLTLTLLLKRRVLYIKMGKLFMKSFIVWI